MIELTEEQQKALEVAGNGPPRVFNPRTQETFVLVPFCESQETKGEDRRQEAEVETPAPPWKHLVVRRHPWRKQLFIKGLNMTVRQLVGTVKASRFTEEEAAKDLHLPVEAIREALAYFESHPEVIALDAAYEQYRRKLRGQGRGPESLPG